MKKESAARNPRKGKKAAVFGMLGGAVIALSACGSGNRKKEAEDRKTIVDDYAQIMMLQDQDSQAYDQVLEEIGAYLEQPDSDKQEKLLELMENTIQDMEKLTDSYVPYQADQEFAKLLDENGISSAEYEMNANGRYQMLAMYIQDLTFLEFYVESADYDEIAMNELDEAYKEYVENQKDMQGYNYTGVNYWFAGWEAEDVEYVKEQVLKRFLSFSVENPVWETERDAVEVRMNTYLNRIEERLDQSAERLGEKQERLYELEKEVKGMER